MFRESLRLLRLYMRGLAALQYATRRDGPGIEFNRFGRQVGWQLLGKGMRSGLEYILTPVSIVRYFEFPFTLSCLSESPRQCLDISSPILFSFYVASRNPSASMLMLNPDRKDSSLAAIIASRLRLDNIRTECSGVDVIENRGEAYDCIWSISVIEHIAGVYDDRHAVKLMYDCLKNGGRLVLTFPVDRRYWNEFRDRDYYGTQKPEPIGKYFFQRYYDKRAIEERIFSSIGIEPSIVRWFGEKSPGRFATYERRWMREGMNCAVDDPREIAENYREFSTWEEMPGMGICGLMFEKSGC
jgi:SAM-dependent methyltransferase